MLDAPLREAIPTLADDEAGTVVWHREHLGFVTQLVVETLVLVIFLLVLNRLPAFYGEVNRSQSIRDGILALAVGATVFVTVLVTTATSPTGTR
ncbi:hypothetical protein C8039_10275 [Halogeometricum sp. wsp3]|nr:hypothetical protein C8039_10275 [Halogeometricum sp. wsp3]